jgi:hypothetical protein
MRRGLDQRADDIVAAADGLDSVGSDDLEQQSSATASARDSLTPLKRFSSSNATKTFFGLFPQASAPVKVMCPR